MEQLGALLIIDDDPDVVRAARLVVASQASQVLTATSITDLEKCMSEQTLDAVLLDMNFLPGERSGRDGLSALARIKRADPHLSVVLMTAFGGVTLAVEALKQGGVDFVLKPWRNEKLLETVRVAVALTRARRNAETLDLEALERAAIERALARHQGNISLAASTLGLSRAALYRRLSKHGLS